MKKNILLSGILLLSFSCAVAQDYHDDVVVLDSVKVMSFNIRFNNPNDSLDTSWDRRREPCARMMAQYRPDVVGMQDFLISFSVIHDPNVFIYFLLAKYLL